MPYAQIKKTGPHQFTITLHTAQGTEIDSFAGSTARGCSLWLMWLPDRLRLRVCRDEHEPPLNEVLARLTLRGWRSDDRRILPDATLFDVEPRWQCPECGNYVAITSSTSTGEPHRAKCSGADACGWVGGVFQLADAEVAW